MELVYGEAQIPSYRRQFTLSRELDASRIELIALGPLTNVALALHLEPKLPAGDRHASPFDAGAPREPIHDYGDGVGLNGSPRPACSRSSTSGGFWPVMHSYSTTPSA